MSEDLSHYIPRRLDDSSKFLFWDLDVASVGLAGLLIGVATDYPITGLLFAGIGMWGYAKLKAGKHPGMAFHLAYWWTGVPTLKELPPSHIRELNG